MPVRAAAISAYVNAGSASPIGLYLQGTPNELATGAAYTQAANDRLTSSIAALNGDEITLSFNLKIEQSDVASAATALSATSASRDAVLAGISVERSELSSVNGELETLVEQDEIAREKAAEAQAAWVARDRAATPETASAAGPPTIVGAAPITTASVPGSLAAAFGVDTDVRVGRRVLAQHGKRLLRRLPVLSADLG